MTTEDQLEFLKGRCHATEIVLRVLFLRWVEFNPPSAEIFRATIEKEAGFIINPQSSGEGKGSVFSENYLQGFKSFLAGYLG